MEEPINRGLCVIPIELLVSAKWNYKGDSEYTMEALVDNLRRNGQIINVIVREIGKSGKSKVVGGRFEVVNGNHRLEALLKIGANAAVCFNLGKVSISEAKRIAIETNETNFSADVSKLSATVTAAVEGTDFDIEKDRMPFNVEEIHRFKEMSAIDWEQKQRPSRKGSAADKKTNEKMTPEQEKEKAKKALEEKSKQGMMYDCPHCGHQFDEE